MDLATWITIGSVCLVGAMSPGPSLAVVVKNTVADGRRQGMATGLGHGLGVGVYACAAVLGVAAVVDVWPWAVRVITVLGGAYLVWMGIGALRHAGAGAGADHQTTGRSGFAEGFTVAFLNPKIAVFFLALLGSSLPENATNGERVGVAALAMIIDGSWYMFAAAALAMTGAAQWLNDQGAVVDTILGILLVSVGAWLLVS